MPHPHARHTVPDRSAFADRTDPDWGGVRWPASWITGPPVPPGPRDTWYRLTFSLAEPTAARIYVSGDQRYNRGLDEPLTIAALYWAETRYPLDTVPLPDVDDPRLSRALPVLERGLVTCMHKSYLDTPSYEQLMYVGDTPLETLCTRVRSPDDRLPMRAIELFGGSIRPGGLTQARYPSAMPQVIPSFALVWVAMLHDLAWWCGRRPFVASFIPAARSVLEAFRQTLGDDGLSGTLIHGGEERELRPGQNRIGYGSH